MTRARWFTTLAGLALVAGTAAPALAQSTEPNFEQFQWNFSNPGARARGMGGAFIGVADDASAAVTNPAGLLSLTRPQAYFEYKFVPTNIQPPANTDSFFTLKSTTFHNQVNFPSFFSVAAPVGSNLAVSFARHQFLYFVDNFTYAPRLSHAGTTLSPLTGATDFRAASYAGSIAVALSTKFRLGLTVSLDRLVASANTTTFKFVNTPTGPVATDTVESTATFGRSTDPGGASSASFTAGFLYRPNARASLGAFYTKSPRFKLLLTLATGAGVQTTEPKDLFIDVPTRFGFGGSIRARRVLIAGDFVVIRYSELLNDFIVKTNALSRAVTSANYRIKDGGELRIGTEINVKRGRTQAFVRVGALLNDDARLHFVTTSNLAPGAGDEEIDKFNLLQNTETGYGSVGMGLVFARRVQFDAAVTTKHEFTSSFMVRF